MAKWRVYLQWDHNFLEYFIMVLLIFSAIEQIQGKMQTWEQDNLKFTWSSLPYCYIVISLSIQNFIASFLWLITAASWQPQVTTGSLYFFCWTTVMLLPITKVTRHPCLGTMACWILIVFSVCKDITKHSWFQKFDNIWIKSEQEIRPKPHQSIWGIFDIYFRPPNFGRCRYIYFKLGTT